jgi:streptogramin lyase
MLHAGGLRRALGVLCVATLVAGCAARRLSTPLPEVYAPATALLHDDPADNPDQRVLLSLTGRGFGAPGSISRVRVRDGEGRVLLDFGSDDRGGVLRWTDRRIILAAPAALAGAGALAVEVEAGGAVSVPAHVALFTYRHVDVPRSPRPHASPLAIAIDDRSRVAVNEEFHTQLKRFDPAAGWDIFDLPQGTTGGIFATELFGGGPTDVSMFGEAVVVDPAGRAWATQGGWMLHRGPHPNHSRIVMLEPEGGAVRIWSVPGDDNTVVGVAYDPATGRVWFTQARRAQRDGDIEHVAYPARLTSFDPRAIPPDAEFDFVPRERCERSAGEHVGVCSATRWRRCLDDGDCLLADRICADGADDGGCFREHWIPTPPGETPLVLPGPLLRHSDGTIWYAGYIGGNFVGRFDPATDTFQRFPLARPPGETSCEPSDCVCFPAADSAETACPVRCCLYQLLGRGPWGLAEDARGGVACAAQEAGAVSLLPAERIDDPRCAALDSSGANPCLSEYPLLDYDPTATQLHSIARDDGGNLWFGEARNGGRDDDPARGASIGYVQAGTGHVILLPPLSLYPFASSGIECRPAGEPVAFSAAGIAFDPRTGAVWFADYCRKRLGEIAPRR